MSNIDVSDIQGFSLKGYNFPRARYLLLELLHPEAARAFVERLLPDVTTGERWDIDKKPMSTVNLAFTYKGLVRLQLPRASLLSFPIEFQQGMKAREISFTTRERMDRSTGIPCGKRTRSMHGSP